MLFGNKLQMVRYTPFYWSVAFMKYLGWSKWNRWHYKLILEIIQAYLLCTFHNNKCTSSIHTANNKAGRKWLYSTTLHVNRMDVWVTCLSVLYLFVPGHRSKDRNGFLRPSVTLLDLLRISFQHIHRVAHRLDNNIKYRTNQKLFSFGLDPVHAQKQVDSQLPLISLT